VTPPKNAIQTAIARSKFASVLASVASVVGLLASGCGDVYELGKLAEPDAGAAAPGLDGAAAPADARSAPDAESGPPLFSCDAALDGACLPPPENPCTGKACGDFCTCPPQDPQCVGAAVLRCDSNGICGGPSMPCAIIQGDDGGGPG
jgi:hypothetical protein